MGLKKHFDIGSLPVPDAYHSVTNVRGNPKGRMRIDMGVFTSKAAYDAGERQLRVNQVTIDLADVRESKKPLLDLVYPKVKAANKYFKDAVDVLDDTPASPPVDPGPPS